MLPCWPTCAPTAGTLHCPDPLISSAASFAPPALGEKSTQLKLPVAEFSSLLLSQVPFDMPSKGSEGVPTPGRMQTPMGMAQLSCAGLSVAVAHAPTVFVVGALPRNP